MASVNQYPKFGVWTVIPSADLTNVASQANLRGSARLGDQGIGKRAGHLAIRDAGAGAYSLVMAMGDAPTAKWRVVDGSAEYTPV